MASITVEIRAHDEDGQEIVDAIKQFDHYTIERAEMEAHLFMVLARVAWREAERLRQAEQRAARRRQGGTPPR